MPDFKRQWQDRGLLIRLTFPAYEAERVTWGVTRLKEIFESAF
ncbi:hypothetical protein [Desulfosarcina cetonica]|nr:hypothetical protein [Desulfosarcina cetonica]